MFKFQKIAAAAVAFGMLLSSTAYASGDANVIVNGQTLDDNAVIINDRVYVPLRSLCESMGASVAWDNDSRSAIIEQNDSDAVTKAIATASESVVAIICGSEPTSDSAQSQEFGDYMGHGAGVIIKSNGTIITNAHVVEDTDIITVLFGNGDTYKATLLYSDKDIDLAVIKIGKLGLKPIKFAEEDSLIPGQSVIAIGTPQSLSMMNAASMGIVSCLDVNIGEHYLYNQSDVTINGGNSGGALINLDGELVGINAIKMVGYDIDNMSFSIPIDTVNYALSSFEKYGKIPRPDTGITLTESWASKMSLPTKLGLGVAKSDNPLILPGDNITAVNGYEVHSLAEYNEALKKTYTGGDLVFSYTRGGVAGEAVITPKNK